MPLCPEARQRKLDLAGNPAGWDSDRVLAWKMLGLFIGGIAGFLLPLLLASRRVHYKGSTGSSCKWPG